MFPLALGLLEFLGLLGLWTLRGEKPLELIGLESLFFLFPFKLSLLLFKG